MSLLLLGSFTKLLRELLYVPPIAVSLRKRFCLFVTVRSLANLKFSLKNNFTILIFNSVFSLVLCLAIHIYLK